eukprot:3932525-Rhodomonas_salina.1
MADSSLATPAGKSSKTTGSSAGNSGNDSLSTGSQGGAAQHATKSHSFVQTTLQFKAKKPLALVQAADPETQTAFLTMLRTLF